MVEEDSVCILCGEPAVRSAYGPDARGWKYRCGGPCPDFAVLGFIHNYLSMNSVFPPDLRKLISEYLVKLEPNPDNYYVLTIEDIEKATGKKIPDRRSHFFKTRNGDPAARGREEDR
jgi:hypothetical protein